MNPASPLPSTPPNHPDKLPTAANDAAITDNRMVRRVVLASILGNGLEWFDFVSYGYFASIIAKVFFPADSNLSLMLTYATFERRRLNWTAWARCCEPAQQ
jgi:hypothetical protein